MKKRKFDIISEKELRVSSTNDDKVNDSVDAQEILKFLYFLELFKYFFHQNLLFSGQDVIEFFYHQN